MPRKPFVRPVVLLLAMLLAVQPLAAAADPSSLMSAEEIAALPAYGPLSYQPATDCQPAYCSEFIQTAESAEGGGGASTQNTWIWIAVIVVLVVAVAAGGSSSGGGY
jgi:hypothetical protein